MKHKITQYILIILILAGITGGYFYFQSNAAQKINASKTTNLTSGLVGYWTFDGADTSTTTATDKSTGGNNGTLTGTPKPTPTIGKIGQALSFDGTNSYITAGTPNLGITDSITECVWIYPKALTDQHILQYVSSADNDSLGIAISSVLGGRIGALDFSNWYQVVSTNPATLNTWQHVCATVNIIAGGNNDIFKLYINGAFDNEAVANYNPYPNSGLMIGQHVDNGGRFNGYIDEPRIYNRVLSASEITELYQQGQTKINASQVNKLTNGLTGYWSFDGADTTWTGASSGTVTNRGSLGGTQALTNMSQSTSPIIGKIGQALNFNAASSQYIDSGVTVRNVLLGSNEGTVSVWLKPTGLPVNTVYDATYLPAIIGDANNWAFGISRGTVSSGPDKIWVFNGWGVNPTVFAGATFTTGEWTHIILQKSATQLCIYKNGIQGDCVPSTAIIAATSPTLRIGSGSSTYFNGGIDELRFYNRVLSDSEITELYQQGQTKINASQTGKLTNGLQGYWTFDGDKLTTSTATDSSANGYNGSLSGSPTPAIGRIGQALNFNGSSSVVTVSGATSPNLDITSALTISAWIKPDVTGSTSWTGIATKGTTAGNSYRMVYEDTGSFCSGNEVLVRFGANTGWQCSGLNSIVPNQWNHVVFTVDSDSWEIYTNNVLGSSGTGSYSKSASTADLLIGNYGGGYFDGSIDEVRVYNRALSQSEVTELYDMGR